MKEEIALIQNSPDPQVSGRVTQVIGLLIESVGPDVFVDELCIIYGKKKEPTLAQVVGFKKNTVLLMSLGTTTCICPGAEVYPTGEVHQISVSEALCGRILNAFGHPIDGRGPLFAKKRVPVSAPAPAPLNRQPISEPLPTGIRAIDAFLTLGKGQRIGIFSSPGVGKSTLMGMIAKMADADVNVIALIGERGREVREFVEKQLGASGLAKSVVVVVTSDQAALLRSKGANVATAIAEYFRELGKHVILIMDSISRYAMALREIGLAIGEPPTTRGYTPSVFAHLPRLLERAGNSEKGSITGFYTILCEDDELPDPIADQMRSYLDGHIHLSSKLAASNHFPPIDILRSLSRVMNYITDETHQKEAGKIRNLLHVYQEAQELVNLGAYVSGANSKIDEALTKIDKIERFLKQNREEKISFEESKRIGLL